MVCLVILFDTVKCSISIPEQKLLEIKQMCIDWSDKRIVSKNELQSLLGSLLYIIKCAKSSRMFLNHMFQLLRNNIYNNTILLTQEFHKEIHWFAVF